MKHKKTCVQDTIFNKETKDLGCTDQKKSFLLECSALAENIEC